VKRWTAKGKRNDRCIQPGVSFAAGRAEQARAGGNWLNTPPLMTHEPMMKWPIESHAWKNIAAFCETTDACKRIDGLSRKKWTDRAAMACRSEQARIIRSSKKRSSSPTQTAAAGGSAVKWIPRFLSRTSRLKLCLRLLHCPASVRLRIPLVRPVFSDGLNHFLRIGSHRQPLLCISPVAF